MLFRSCRPITMLYHTSQLLPPMQRLPCGHHIILDDSSLLLVFTSIVLMSTKMILLIKNIVCLFFFPTGGWANIRLCCNGWCLSGWVLQVHFPFFYLFFYFLRSVITIVFSHVGWCISFTVGMPEEGFKGELLFFIFICFENDLVC